MSRTLLYQFGSSFFTSARLNFVFPVIQQGEQRFRCVDNRLFVQWVMKCMFWEQHWRLITQHVLFGRASGSNSYLFMSCRRKDGRLLQIGVLSKYLFENWRTWPRYRNGCGYRKASGFKENFWNKRLVMLLLWDLWIPIASLNMSVLCQLTLFILFFLVILSRNLFHFVYKQILQLSSRILMCEIQASAPVAQLANKDRRV